MLSKKFRIQDYTGIVPHKTLHTYTKPEYYHKINNQNNKFKHNEVRNMYCDQYACWKRYVFNDDLKWLSSLMQRKCNGSSFHRRGATEAKARSPHVFNLVLGTQRRPKSTERRVREGLQGTSSSVRYAGPRLLRER